MPIEETGRCPLLFRYPGGKHYAMKILEPFWEAVGHEEYREPFVGGGSVFLNKPKVPFNWLNDIDNELTTTLRVISDPVQRDALVRLLSQESANRQRWEEVRQFSPSSEIETAFKYYYLNRTSFSGKLVSAAWGYREKRSVPPARWAERIEPCGKKLEGVRVTSLDFERVISEPSNRPTLLYVDPPYFLPPKYKHYRFGFDPEDHERLAQSLRETPHFFFLTYDDAPQVRDLYRWANVVPVEFIYRVENSSIQGGVRRQGFELVITNFDLPKFSR